ncbi:MAG: hypothetical protein IPM64_14750 [Phycisphaerales bacterium]|nr:hypothetical protein [Phycisphaerales bacterium]
MTTPVQGVVRGRCGCGRRLRIRNAHAGAHITCPGCGRSVALSASDVAAGVLPDEVLFVAPEEDHGVPPPEADLVVADAPIRPARAGSRPGLAHVVDYAHEEVALSSALGGYSTTPRSAALGFGTGGGSQRVVRDFWTDLLASFYFAGVWNNALNLVLTAGMIALLTSLAAAIPLVGLLVKFLVLLYALQFSLTVFECTVRGDDEVPWFISDFNVYEDIIAPMLRLLAVTFACALPGAVFLWFVRSPTDAEWIIYYSLTVVGFLFWPIAMMAVMLEETIFCLRPGMLLHAMFRIGPRYLVACGMLCIVIAGWSAFLGLRVSTGSAAGDIAVGVVRHLLAPFISLYFGYALFRTVALLYRHFHARLPWRT